MANSVITCPACSVRNRVPNNAAGKPRCASCHADLPWLIEVSGAEFADVIERSALPVLVDLWAPWCGPCRAVAPLLEQLANDRAGALRVVKVNVDQAPEVSAGLGVQGIPTMVMFSGGLEVSRQVGALPADRLRWWADAAVPKSSAP
jgi:thioredoxin 2